MAERQGFALEKSRRRDPHALDYGCYRVVDPNTNTVVAGYVPYDYSLSLDEVEAWLTDGERVAARRRTRSEPP
jgi:hypothetical protein